MIRETRAEKETRRIEAISYLREALRPAGQPIRKDTTRFAPRTRSRTSKATRNRSG